MDYPNKLLKTTEIHDNIVRASVLINQQTKQGLYQQSTFVKDFLMNNPKPNAYQLKSLSSILLTYWNESITTDTETFWDEMKRSNIDIERKEPLRFALKKGWFRNVEQGIDARNHWRALKEYPSIVSNYTPVQIEQLDRIIAEDEKNRHEVLKKCLMKKVIPQTQYLKFGECMAYFGRCNLFEVYFTKAQVDELFAIWQNFKSQ